ncbi:MAG: hypothetical protein K5851_07620 [Lachnospiraceae bacterium]|nr:hypothetical protein [Lachnospiraceae bacterium]
MNQNHKIIWKKGAAVACAAMIGLSSVACGTSSAKVENKNDEYTIDKKELKSTLTSTSFGTEDKDTEKVETVYVKANANGNVNDVIVSDWLKNYKGEDKIIDKTSLSKIKNVKGDEKYKKNSDGTITWNADGNDIYYQGHATKDVPVNVNVSYKLNGKKISAKDLAGKSGKVTITFNYENNAKEKVNVNGTEEEVTVPFAMISGMILPTDKFKNVSVSNGQVISDSSKNIVVGAALPGLKDALKLDSAKVDAMKDVNIPETVEITADTTDFELGMTMTMASSNVLSELGFTDVDATDSLNKVEDSMKLLQDSTDKLVDGSKKLSDGTNTLKSGTSTLKDGVKTYTNGVSDLTNGIGTLLNGVNTLADGSQQLSDGTDSLYNQLNAGVFNNESLNGLLSSYNTVNAKLKAAPYKSLYDSIDGMNKAQAAFASMPQENQLALLNMATSVATNGQLSSYQTLVQAMPDKASDVQKLAVVSLMMSAANGKNGSDLTSAAVVGNYYTEYTAQANQLKSEFNARGTNETADVKDGAVNANGTLWLSTTGSFQQEWNKLAYSAADGDTTAATEYYARYTAFMTKYASIKQLSDSLPALKKGVSDLKTGANTLNAGIKNTLLPGVKALYDGASLLNGNSGKLVDGTSQLDSGALTLSNGALELSNGLVKFNEEGISKLSSAFTGELKDFTDRIKAVDAASKEYKSFSGADDKMSSSVKFLIETKGINADK